MTEHLQPLILIVDDNAQNAKLACDVLRASGFRTLDAATGAEGIALATEYEPDLILMDVRLPDMDGVAAAQTLHVGTRTSRIPVVALSALRLDGERDWLLAAGFAGAIEKPIDVCEFPDRIGRYCGRDTG